MRILHLPSQTGCNAWRLSRGERRLGWESDVLCTRRPPFDYPCDRLLDVGGASALRSLASRVSAFLRVRGQYDVFHFNAGKSLIDPRRFGLHLLDLPHYPEPARLFVTFNGCDARQKGPTLARRQLSACGAGCASPLCARPGEDRIKAERIALFSRHVTRLFALNPDLMHVLPAEKATFLPYAYDAASVTPVLPATDGPLVVAHAPSDRSIKGTDAVLEAFRQVAETHGRDFEALLIENMSHQRALEALARADVLVDQLMVGWYGGVALEAWALGKVVVCRLEQEDLRFLPDGMAADLRETVVDCPPGQLADTLRGLVENRAGVRSRARAGVEYVRTWHQAETVARRVAEWY